jgi:hypothetical protein
MLGVIEEARLSEPALRDVPVRVIGIPAGSFVDHGSVVDLRRVTRLDVEGIVGQIRETIAALELMPRRREITGVATAR